MNTRMMYANVLYDNNNRMEIDEKNILFQEHFHDFPLLPGAFSIGYCVERLFAHLSTINKKQYALKCIKKITFLKPIFPHTRLKFCLLKSEERDKEILFTVALKDETENSYLRGIMICEETP